MAKGVRGKKFDVGIDLTSNEIRVIALTRKGTEYVLERFAIAEVNPQFFAAGRVADPKGLGERIKEVLQNNGISGKRAILSLSGKAAITRIIELPRMGAAQTRQAISLQINQYVPFPVGDTVYDYRVLPHRKGSTSAMQEVLLVATRASTVQSMVNALEYAGLEPFAIKITSLAAWNLLGPKLEGYTQSVGIIDVRDTISELSLFVGGSFRMARSIELGFNTIVTKIAQLLGVSVAEAEEYLKSEPVDLTLPEEEVDPTEDNRLREAVMSVFASFVTELIRSIRYYESQATRTERVGKLLVFGNIRYFKNLAPYLERETGLEVSEVALSTLVQFVPGAYPIDILQEASSKLLVAAGLAAEFGKRGKVEFNLLPTTYYVRAQAWNAVKVGVVLVAVVGVLMYMDYRNGQREKALALAELNSAQAEAAKWQPKASEFDSVKQEISGNVPKFNWIYNLVKEQRMWPAIMTELGSRTPDGIVVTEVDFESAGNEIRLSGFAVTRMELMLFAISLDNSNFFTRTTVDESVEEEGGGGGGRGAGGGGGPASVGAGGMSARGPDRSTTSFPMDFPAKGIVEPSASRRVSASATQQFELPRLGLFAGQSIEDYFGVSLGEERMLKYSFEITTYLEESALVQPEAIKELSALEEVTKDVLST